MCFRTSDDEIYRPLRSFANNHENIFGKLR